MAKRSSPAQARKFGFGAVATGQPIGPPIALSSEARGLVFSPDGKTAAIGARDNTVQLWDVTPRQRLGKPLPHPDLVTDIAFTPDGGTLATGCFDRIARFWDVATGRSLHKPLVHTGLIRTVAFGLDGKMVLISDGVTGGLWDVATGAPLVAPFGPSRRVSSAAFSPDRKVVLLGLTESKAQLWDVATGLSVGPPFPEFTSEWTRSSRVKFSPDGRFLVLCNGRTARLWNAPGPLPDDLPRLSAWVEAITGLQLDAHGSIHVLDRSAWLAHVWGGST